MHSSLLLRLSALAACFHALAGTALAQSFPPDSAFVPLHCGDAVMTDRYQDESGAIDERDIVGDSDHAAGYRAVDAQFLYLRMRLDADSIPGGTIRPFAWGMEIDIDGDRTDYEILGLVDGVSGNVLLYRNSTTTLPNDPTDPADTPAVATYPASSHARSSTAAGTSNGANPDFFITIALPWADLGPLGLDRDTPVVVWAASSSSSNTLNGDFACHDGATGEPTLSGTGSDHTVLDPVIDSDNDGVPDAEEVEAGTDPNDPTSRPGGNALAGGGGCGIGPAAPGSPFAVLLAFVLILSRFRRVPRRTAGRRRERPPFLRAKAQCGTQEESWGW